MMNFQTTEDIYSAVRRLTGELERLGLDRPAGILAHRMTKVAWTTGSELLDELLKVLVGIQSAYAEQLPNAMREEITSLCESIRKARGK